MVYPCFKYALFVMEIWYRLPAAVFDLLEDVSTDTASMGTTATLSGGTGGEPRYLLPYIVEEYICPYTPKLDAGRFAIIPTGEVFLMRAGLEEQETAFAGWVRKRKHWGRKWDLTVETYADYMDIPFIRSFDEGS